MWYMLLHSFDPVTYDPHTKILYLLEQIQRSRNSDDLS